LAQISTTTTGGDLDAKVETWFGWVEAPKQQLRTFVRVRRGADNRPTSASIISPDQTADELLLQDFQIDSEGVWKFQVNNPVTTKLSATFEGRQNSDQLVVGDLKQSGETLSLKLQRLDSMPVESRTTLGADSVWTGTLNVVVQKLDFRFRVYNTPPYATLDAPRVLFDSLSEKFVGIPATVTMDGNRSATFDIKLIKAKYTAALNEEGTELSGKFTQGPLPIPLKMKLVQAESDVKNDIPKKDGARERAKTREAPPTERIVDIPAQSIEKPATRSKRGMASSEFFEERDIEVVYGETKPRGKNSVVASGGAGIKLSGTLTLPKSKDAGLSKRYPAVVMVSGSGPQDRDETIGRHKPFAVLAHFLAENGIASIRYDDRGVGESTGDFLTATSVDFAKDAVAVWNFAKSIDGIDGHRVGILGHSEGGIVGPMAASWEPGIAFLILLAPPGLTGSEVLKTQIDRMSELQGMSETDRAATSQLQQELQELATGYFQNDEDMRQAIRNAINKNWDGLKNIAAKQDPLADLMDIKTQLTTQIEHQFQQLRMPWYRHFLSHDPSIDWMLIRCPTLAIWGGNDVQVLPEINRSKLIESAERNLSLNATMEILPGLNHLLQTCQSGLPEEYDQIEETISPLALARIRAWAEENGIIDRR
jgi:pimeloyl-ACP methyl ester carboxylesterase